MAKSDWTTFSVETRKKGKANNHPRGWTENITKMFLERKREGLDLYSITSHLGYIPGLRSGGVWYLWELEKRLVRFWHSMMTKLYNNPRTSRCLCVVFFDVCEKGDLHVHMLIAINWSKVKVTKSRERGWTDFNTFWKDEHAELVGRRQENGKADILKTAVLGLWDGDERMVQYFSRGYSDESGLAYSDTMFLGVEDIVDKRKRR